MHNTSPDHNTWTCCRSTDLTRVQIDYIISNLAQYRAQASGPPDLLCPLCRHGQCPDCLPGGWSGEQDALLRALCRRHGLAIPERLSGESTVREAIRDYTLRTFTSSDAPEPPPPPGIAVLCCQRLAAMGHAGGVDFVPLPHREMQWAPIPIRHGAGIAAWRPAWLCPGCAQEVRLDALQIPAGVGGPCNRCGAVTRWEYDRVTGRGTCSCTAGWAGPVNPPALTTPALQPPAETTAPPVSAPAASQASRPTAAFWLSRGPPSGEVRDPTNSWLYVPLLHAAAADLAPTALDAWRTDPRTSDWWEHARQLLAASAPVTPQHLVAALAQVAETAPAHAHHMPDLVARINNACLPTGACVHVGWAVRQLREQDGYLLAPVQETLLQCFGGSLLASAVDRHSDRFRPAAGPPPQALPAAGHSQQPAEEALAPDDEPAHPDAEAPAEEAPAPDNEPTRPDADGDDAALAAAALRAREATVSRGAGRGRRGRGRGRRANSPAPNPDPAPPDPQPPATQRGLAAASAEAGVRQGLASLDAVDLQATCRQRVFTLQSAPARIRGALRTAMRTGLRLAVHPVAPEDAQRGWKFFCLAPRMFLFRSPGESRIPSAELERRCELFRAGHWPDLLRQSASAAAVPPSPRRGDPSDAQRARRAAALVRLGELSAAGHALTAQPLAAGSSDTLAELRDPARRPPAPYAPLPEPVLQHAPAEACPLPLPAFLRCLRSARRGSAPGPSGATNEHIRILLDDDEDARLLHGAAVRLANADVPPEVLEGIRVGRLVALRKPNGRVRALVIGDVLRRLVGRVLAQHFAPHLQQACMPHQFGLSTRAGTEAVSRLLRAATEACPRATVLSVDAVGAFDHVSRGAMLGALHARPQLQPLLAFARQFYAAPSTYTWYDEADRAHVICQGEGGEQGDPLMPALYALAQHEALCDLQSQLRDGEAVFAFLDDTYIVAAPERVRTLYDALASALWDRARIRLHQGKTRIWNAAGEEPPDIADLGEGEESVWVGDWTLPPESQGLTALGSPLGHDAFVARQLQHKRDDHDRLLASIPAVNDLQAAWLLLRFCAAPRANYLLRTLPPHLTADFAAEHDAAVARARCLATLLEQGDTPLPPTSLNTAQLAQRFGGLGLRSAWQDRFATHWASWCDTLPVILARAPAAAARLRAALQGDGALPSTAAATHARAHLCDLGFEAPAWADLCSGAATAPPDPDHADDPWPVKGWQRSAARACDKRAYETHLSDLTPASRALLLSQAGPFASRALNLMPTRDDIAIPSAQFRVLLLRPLRLPLPLAPRRCRCHGALDPLGDHRTACATSGVLATRALPLEHAVARVCREAGARVARHVKLADMNLDVPVADERRIEVVANGLPLWHGSQLALDATIVSPLTRRGEAHPHADVQPGCAVAAAARRKRCQTYPELGRARRCRLVVVGIETGGRFGTEAVQLLRLLARHRADSVPAHLRPAAITSWVARWSGLLAVAAQRAYAATLLELPPAAELGEGPMPDLHEVLADARWD